MNAASAGAASSVIPTFRYHDAPAAIDWLCRVLGFEAHLIVPGEADGIVAHAQLTLGNGMIMLGAGALIVMDLAEQDYGGKLYACRDPEGQLWNIGSYDPWGGAQG